MAKIEKVEDLPGVGPAAADKLVEAGYKDLMAIAAASPGELKDAIGMGEASAKRIIGAAQDAMDMGFETGTEVMKRREQVGKLTTGSSEVDKMLGGGVESGSITEFYGKFAAGKCVGKDTSVIYTNDSVTHLENIGDIYNKYSQIYGENPFDDGFLVETPPVKVWGLTKEGIRQTQAKSIYKEFVKTLFEVKTKRGRKLRITGPHKLLSFDGGLAWKPASILGRGDLIAYPREIISGVGNGLTADDAYFTGMFVAEGTANPLSIATGSKKTRDWVSEYIKNKFGYVPTVREDKRREDPVYTILLRKSTVESLGGLHETSAKTKFVPESILSGGLEVVSGFLAGYLDGDGHLSKMHMEVVSASRELCSGVSYLLMRLGISATTREKMIKGKRYYRLFVVGEDRELLNGIPFKEKKCLYKPRNSTYGYPKDVISFLQGVYKESLGGNRGRHGKPIGRMNNNKDTFYHYLVQRGHIERAMGDKTLKKVAKVFYEGRQQIDSAISLAEGLGDATRDEFLALYHMLPFAFSSIGERVGLTKSCLRNYANRGLPKDKKVKQRIGEALLAELNERRSRLDFGLSTIKNLLNFNFDEIEEIQEIEYNDYVYDFIVPDGHSFIGGGMPTVLHNTQLTHQLTVNVQLPKEKGGFGGKALYIDSEGTFRPERIVQMARYLKLDPDTVLENIMVGKAYNSDHQMLLAEKSERMIAENNIRLIIVDSLMGHFRSEFVGRGTLAERQQKLNRHLSVLGKIADTQNLPVVVTNQVMAQPGLLFGDPTEPIGGHILGHKSTFRLYLRKGKGGKRVAKLVDSPHLPEAECIFSISEKGITD